MDNKKTITIIILGLVAMAGILLFLFLQEFSYQFHRLLLFSSPAKYLRRQFLALEVLSHQNYLVHSRLLLSSLSLSFST